MENDEKNTNIVENAKPQFKNFKYFKSDFAGQNLKNRKEFINWNNEMRKKYGKTDYFYNCSKDSVVFYELNNFAIIAPNYYVSCPKCKSFICYFCSKNLNSIDKFEYCCLRRLICYLFFRFEDNEIFSSFNGFYCFQLQLIIPILNVMLISVANNVYVLSDSYLEKENLYIIMYLMSVIIAIPYIFFFYEILLIICIISIPLRLIPIKTLIGYISANL